MFKFIYLYQFLKIGYGRNSSYLYVARNSDAPDRSRDPCEEHRQEILVLVRHFFCPALHLVNNTDLIER